MGTNIKDLVIKKEVDFEDLKGKKLAVDSFNILYQFLSTIRQRDGSLLMDSEGNVTSHLTGLFSRTTNLMKKGIKPAFVFDGKPPELKEKERQRRRDVKLEAGKRYEKAKKEKDMESMKKYASRTSKLTGEMIEESKALVNALGLPVIQAPSEGEAQVAHIVNKGEAFAGVSEDYDSLLYGVNRLIKNLALTGRRKFGATYVTIKPNMINISDMLNNLGIDQDQLIVLGILVGTDYNPPGIKGIGPKTALKIIREYGTDFDRIFEEVKWKEHYDIDWEEIYYLFKKMPVETDYEMSWSRVNKEKIHELLVETHEFSKERVEKSIKDLMKKEEDKKQTGLGDFV